MGRKARPYIWRGWYVTEAGGKGIHKLCPVADGIDKAEEELERWVEKCRKEKEGAAEAGLVLTDTPYTVAEAAADFLAHKKVTRPKSFGFYQQFINRFRASVHKSTETS
jgi:hypothetical protein